MSQFEMMIQLSRLLHALEIVELVHILLHCTKGIVHTATYLPISRYKYKKALINLKISGIL
jgi:hypothetical protein